MLQNVLILALALALTCAALCVGFLMGRRDAAAARRFAALKARSAATRIVDAMGSGDFWMLPEVRTNVVADATYLQGYAEGGL